MPRLPQKYGLCDGDQEVQISETQLGKWVGSGTNLRNIWLF
jgi:hypothetical protein